MAWLSLRFTRLLGCWIVRCLERRGPGVRVHTLGDEAFNGNAL